MLNWILLVLIGAQAILTREIFSTGCIKDEIISENNQETVETSPREKSEGCITEIVVEEQEEVEKKEILSIYLSNGESFFHELDSMGLSSQEIIAAWKNLKPGGDLVVEDSDGWSMYVMDQISAITILNCDEW